MQSQLYDVTVYRYVTQHLLANVLLRYPVSVLVSNPEGILSHRCPRVPQFTV